MQRVRRIAFNTLTAASAILFVLVAALWFHARSSPIRQTMMTAKGLYTLHCGGDIICLTGPPTDGWNAASVRQSVAGIRNEDVFWNDRAQRPRVEYRSGSGSDRVSKRMFQDNQWALSAAVDDPQLFIAASFLLDQLVPEIDVHGAVNVVFMPPFLMDGAGVPVYRARRHRVPAIVSTGGHPQFDATSWPAVRNYWHDRLDRSELELCFAWPMTAAMLLPLVWIARPRRQPAKAARWVFNFVSLASFLLWVGCTVLWLRSYDGGTEIEWIGGPYMDGRANGYSSVLLSSRGMVQWTFTKRLTWAMMHSRATPLLAHWALEESLLTALG